MQYRYDGSKDKCPLPLVKTRVMLKKMVAGDTCIIRISDQGSKSDIPRLLTKQGIHYSSTQVTPSVIELLIEIGK